MGTFGEVPGPCKRGVQQETCRAEWGPHTRPALGRGLTHTFISLADSYTPTVRRSWRCAATSSSSTAALTICILGQGRGGGQRPAGHSALGSPPGTPDLKLLTSAPRCRTPPALPVSCCSYNPQWKAAPRQSQRENRKSEAGEPKTFPRSLSARPRPSDGSEILPQKGGKRLQSSQQE